MLIIILKHRDFANFLRKTQIHYVHVASKYLKTILRFIFTNKYKLFFYAVALNSQSTKVILVSRDGLYH